MPSQETVHVSPMEVTPTLGKGTLGTRSFHRSVGSRTQRRRKPYAGDGTRPWANRLQSGRMRIGA